MSFILFSNLSESDKVNAVEKLVSQSTPSSDFFFMVVLSVLMASFGILIDSIAVVIGSMLIAPLLSPILSLSLGITMSDSNLIRRSFFTLGKSILWGVIAAAVAVFLFSGGKLPVGAIKSLNPSFLYMGVAIIAGFAASFAVAKPKLNETLPGAAIAVAIIPPIAVVGAGIATLNRMIITNAVLVLLLNMIGIIFASMITFSLMHFYVKRQIAKETVIEEDKKLEEEEGKYRRNTEL